MKLLSLSTSLFYLAIGLFSSASHAQNQAQQTLKTGEQVYNHACVACHSTGVASAPKLGDKKAWAPLIAEGQDVLTAHAWVGVRAMPSQGGAPDLSMVEFARGVAWMASQSGGDWRAPDADMMKRIGHEAKARLSIEIKAKQELLNKIDPN